MAVETAIQKRRSREATSPDALAERAGFTLDPWQADVLRSTDSQIILNCSRQSGKSTVSALLALHQALYTADSLVLLLSPSLRQSIELFRKTKAALYSLGSDSQAIEEESALRIEFANGSRIVSLPGSETSVRGYSNVALLVIDEAARVEDDLYQAIRPMLAVSRGRIVLLSTPFGKRGFFWKVWSGEGEWKRVQVTAYDCPRIEAAWLEAEKLQIPDVFFRSEYLCEFVEQADQVFRLDDIEAAFAPSTSVEAVNGTARRFGPRTESGLHSLSVA